MTGAQEKALPKVLVIDDDDLTRQVVGTILRQGGYACLFARQGEEGLELARNQKPRLIILDIIMPGLNGFEVLRYLKASPLTASIPVIFLTGQIHQAEKSQARNLGAVDYVEKPFEGQDLLTRVDAYLKTQRQERDLAYYNARLTRLAQEAITFLTPGGAGLAGPGQEEEPYNQLVAKINQAQDTLDQLSRQWRAWQASSPTADQGLTLTLTELRDHMTEIRDLADHLRAISGWPAN
ncbi:MAG: response regulator [Deltaproteobacteria bacterium]|jgi:DNA-binding response OmpR family regulator|nr:response regulator [Deltaproteobacteria bacterium]